MTTFHKDLTTTELHISGYVSESDPGAVGAGMEWFQPSTRRIRKRNNADDGWLDPVTIPPIRTETTDDYTLVLSDIGSHLRISDGSAATVTVPKDSTVDFPVGTRIWIEQLGAGAVDIVPEAVTPDLRSFDGDDRTAGQYAVVELLKVGADEWVLTGDLTFGPAES